MSANSVQVVTISVPNDITPTDNQAQGIPPGISYQSARSFNIRTLSSDGANGNDQTGLLYTPDLEDGDACIADSAQYVQNATRRANLPPVSYRAMAIAPWTSADCALNYMMAARDTPNNRGFIFFLPGNSSEAPPDEDDSTWYIEGRWKQDNGYPVYAVASTYGAELMAQSANYNANATDVPNGHVLIENGVSPTDYIRLYAIVDTGSATTLPSLWVFLLVVLAVLLTIIALTSLAMHLIQRRRRQNLRRRIARGEVDLEALGIKRLTVPQELLDSMPVYTYGASASVAESLDGSETMDSSHPEKDGHAPTAHPGSRPTLAHTRARSFNPSPLSQPTCPICLEDFELASSVREGSTVRELPCQHIFHPECVDSFLRVNSSLCPMCKKSALPRGYCPKEVTSAMVRRERLTRRVRPSTSSSTEMQRLDERRVPLTFGQRVRTLPGFGRRFSSAPITESQRMEELDMRASASETRPRSPSSPGTSPTATPVQARSAVGHREWARQRAVNMLGHSAPVDPDSEELQSTPAWRRGVRRVFPGFGR